MTTYDNWWDFDPPFNPHAINEYNMEDLIKEWALPQLLEHVLCREQQTLTQIEVSANLAPDKREEFFGRLEKLTRRTIAEYVVVDDALKRDGRMIYGEIRINSLDCWRAAAVYKRLTGKVAHFGRSNKTLAEVYCSAAEVR